MIADFRGEVTTLWYLVVLGDTENFFHDIYREKVSRYWVYHDTCFASGVIEGGAEGAGGVQLREQLPPGAVQHARGHKKLYQNILMTTKVSLTKFATTIIACRNKLRPTGRVPSSFCRSV